MENIVVANNTVIISDNSDSVAVEQQGYVIADPNSSEVSVYFPTSDVLATEVSKSVAVINYDFIYDLNSTGTGGFPEAPQNNLIYGRRNAGWVPVDFENDPAIYNQLAILNAFKDTALGLGLDPLDAFTTINYLIEKGVLKHDPLDPGDGVTPVGPPYMETPPKPIGLYANGGINDIRLDWVSPSTMYLNHGITEIWRYDSVTGLVGLMQIGESLTSSFNDSNIDPDIDYFYNIRFVSNTGVVGPFMDDYTESSSNNDPTNILDLLEEQIRDSQLHPSLLDPIQLITAPGGIVEQLVNNSLDIQNEVTNRVAAVQAEANARAAAISEEAVNRGNAITEAVTILEEADQNLVQQIQLITSVSNSSFDSAELWQFDTSDEDWTNIASVTEGWATPIFTSNTFVTSPGINIDGSYYGQVRLRIRKIGNPAWSGTLQFTTTTDTVFSTANQLTIPAPVFIGQEAAIVFNMAQLSEWGLSFITGIRIQLSVSADSSNHYDIDWVAIGRLGPGLSTAAILEEREAWTAADAAEATQRLTLATQLRGGYTGNDINSLTSGLIYQERQARSDAVSGLAVQISSLSAGNANQFDYTQIWYFDSGVEGWLFAVVENPGFIRPNNTNNFVRVAPTTFSGGQYPQVRCRIRKVGSPTWFGNLTYTYTSGGSSSNDQLNLPAPTFDSNNYALLTWDFSSRSTWINNSITQMDISLQDEDGGTGNYYAIDWVAIGRPAPGASYADLVEEQQVRAAQDSALASSITSLTSTVAGKASQAALDSLSTTVTAQGGTLTVQGNKIVSLESQLNPYTINANPSFANWTATLPDGWTQWENLSFTKHTGAYAYTGGNAIQFVTNTSSYYGIRQDVGNVSNNQYVDIELTFTLVSGSLSGSGVLIDWVNTSGTNFRGTAFSLSAAFIATDIIGKKTVAKFRFKRPAGFTGTFNHYRIFLLANYAGDGLGALAVKTIVFDRLALLISDASAKSIELAESRITNTENELVIQASQLDSVESELAGKASSTALSALQTTVTEQGGQISAQATQIGQLQVSVPGSGNLLQNSEFLGNSMEGWSLENAGSTAASMGINTYSILPAGANVLTVSRVGTSSGALNGISNSIPVIAGQYYSFQARVASVNASIYLQIRWYNSSNTWIATSQSTLSSATPTTSLATWILRNVPAVAPANATTAKLLFSTTAGSQTLPTIMIAQPMFAQIDAATVTTTPRYSPASTAAFAQIQTESIVRASETGPLMAQWSIKSNVNDLQGGVGFYNDGLITRFAIHADQFWVWAPGKNAFSLIIDGTDIVMPGGKLQALSVTASKIAAGTITADKMNVTNLSAITANLGTVTAGNFRTAAADGTTRVEIDSAGSYPFWIGSGTKNATNLQVGYDASVQNFIIREPSTNRRFEFQPSSALPFWYGIGSKSSANGLLYFENSTGRLTTRNLQVESAYVTQLESNNYASSSTAGFKLFSDGSAHFRNVVISRPNVIASGTINPPGTTAGGSHFEGANLFGSCPARSPYSIANFVSSAGYAPDYQARIFVVDIPTSTFNPADVGVINGAMLTAQAVVDSAVVYFSGAAPANFSTPCSAEVVRVSNYGASGSYIRVLIKVHAPFGVPSNVTGISITQIRWALSSFT